MSNIEIVRLAALRLRDVGPPQRIETDRNRIRNLEIRRPLRKLQLLRARLLTPWRLHLCPTQFNIIPEPHVIKRANPDLPPRKRLIMGDMRWGFHVIEVDLDKPRRDRANNFHLMPGITFPGSPVGCLF